MEANTDREHLLEAHTAKKALHYMDLWKEDKDKKAAAAERESKKRKYEDEREEKEKRAKCKFCSTIGHFSHNCRNPGSIEERRAVVEEQRLCPACLGPASAQHQLYSCKQLPYNLELTCRQPAHIAAHVVHNRLICDLLYPPTVPVMEHLVLDDNFEEEIQV